MHSALWPLMHCTQTLPALHLSACPLCVPLPAGVLLAAVQTEEHYTAKHVAALGTYTSVW